MDIAEGSCNPKRFGFGRILSRDTINEYYFTIKLFGWRLFVARGNYQNAWRPDLPPIYSYRYWIQRNV